MVQLFNLAKGFFADGLLVISQKKASKLATLEEIFALVLLLGHGQDGVPHRTLRRGVPRLELELDLGAWSNLGQLVQLLGGLFARLDLAELIGDAHPVAREVDFSALLRGGVKVLFGVVEAAQAHTRLLLELGDLGVARANFVAQVLPLLLLEKRLVFQVLFVFKNVAQDQVARLAVLLDDAVVDDLLDTFLGQVVQLLPVAGGVEALVLERSGRVLLDVAPLAFEQQLLDQVGVGLLEGLHLRAGLGAHRGLPGLVLEQFSLELARLLPVVGLRERLLQLLAVFVEVVLELLALEVVEVLGSGAEGVVLDVVLVKLL